MQIKIKKKNYLSKTLENCSLFIDDIGLLDVSKVRVFVFSASVMDMDIFKVVQFTTFIL